MKKLALHWKILIGMVLGILVGVLASIGQQEAIIIDWVKPIGTVFINMLKLIAIPLILFSLIKGISDLKDISKFSKLGLKTIVIYVFTTVVAVSIGLIMVNITNPGLGISSADTAEITQTYAQDAVAKVDAATNVKESGPLQFIIDMVPDNFFAAASSNGNMLQIIFFSIFFGISLLLIAPEFSEPVVKLVNGLNEVIMKMVDLIMLIAPYAVFALLASLIVETKNPDLFIALSWYALTVLGGLTLMIGFYLTALYLYAKVTPIQFFKGFGPAQLLAFSSSSSAATLPVTMERLEEHLGVDKEITSFVCPVGATINMDGTSLYQAVAAVFICQALNFELSFADQLTIIVTATLASIGSAAVPGAGMVMLVVVLESLDFPPSLLSAGLALIFAVDRPLDMCRTVINVTGDAVVSLLMAKSEGKLHTPHPKNWDDNI